MRGCSTAAWDWRGKGRLMLASSHWGVLRYTDWYNGDQWLVI